MRNGWFKEHCYNVHYKNNILHNDNGPSMVWDDGSKVYHRFARYHRLDGPAVEYANGTKEWWVNGKRIKCKTQEEFERLIKLKAFW